MAKNFIKSGDPLTLIAPAGGVTTGVPLVLVAIFAIPLTTAAATEEFEGATEGLWSLAKNTAKAFTEGEKVWWDDTAKECKGTGIGDFEIGVAEKAELAAATTLRVRLNGVAVTAS